MELLLFQERMPSERMVSHNNSFPGQRRSVFPIIQANLKGWLGGDQSKHRMLVSNSRI